jgi:hypothetical protein
MRAAVVPGVEMAIEMEDTDFGLSTPDNPAIALGEFADAANTVLSHARLIQNDRPTPPFGSQSLIAPNPQQQ